MKATNIERIEIDLPQDIIFAMRGLGGPEGVKSKLKTTLAIFLFQKKAISLGKATELTEMTRARFLELLKEHHLAAYEYTENDFKRDQQAIASTREEIGK